MPRQTSARAWRWFPCIGPGRWCWRLTNKGTSHRDRGSRQWPPFTRIISTRLGSNWPLFSASNTALSSATVHKETRNDKQPRQCENAPAVAVATRYKGARSVFQSRCRGSWMQHLPYRTVSCDIGRRSRTRYPDMSFLYGRNARAVALFAAPARAVGFSRRCSSPTRCVCGSHPSVQ